MLGSYLNAICQYIGSGQNLIGKVKLLVEECYGDSQFGLSAAADRLGVNNSYLSRLFKKETDENWEGGVFTEDDKAEKFRDFGHGGL